MIQFECPFCQHSQEYPDSLIGQLETCPTCGNQCQITLARPPAVARRKPPLSARRAKSAKMTMLCLFSGCILLTGLGVVLSRGGNQAGWWVFGSGMLLLVIMLAGMPGAIAREKRMANADGISLMGILGMVIPIIWLVALILAMAGSSAPRPAGVSARRPCPKCGESIPVAARICRFCGTAVAR